MADTGYQPPSDVSEEQTKEMIEDFMDRSDIPIKTGDRGFVEDIIRIEAVDMEWDLGMSIHEPEDPSQIPTGADGKKVGIFLLHGGSSDFKGMHEQANLLARKLGYKVVSMSFPGRHAFHTDGRDWPGSNVTAHDYSTYSLEVRTPIWKRGEHITRDQYNLVKHDNERPKYGIETFARAKPGTRFYHRMAGWPIAFEQGGTAVMEKHFPEDEFSIYVHGHSTGGPFVNMLSQRVPNIEGILSIENSPFGYIGRERQTWAGGIGKIDGYEEDDFDLEIPKRVDDFNELYIRSWRDRARYKGSELLGEEGPSALMRLPMVMEDILDDWGDLQPRAMFKAEYVITHAIYDSLEEAAKVTAERMELNETETEELVEHYLGLVRELEGPDAKPVPSVLFQIAANSRDHSREVYEDLIIPRYQEMDPAPKTALTQFAFGKHGYMDGEYVEAVDHGIGPAVFQQWDKAISSGYFT